MFLKGFLLFGAAAVVVMAAPQAPATAVEEEGMMKEMMDCEKPKVKTPNPNHKHIFFKCAL